MLNKRDKERFRSALKDLKDYEIYKEVMETAMIKLQSELEAYVTENSVRFDAKYACCFIAAIPISNYHYCYLCLESEKSSTSRGATSGATQKVSQRSRFEL